MTGVQTCALPILDGSHRNTMRLNFSFVAEEKMEPGMKLLGEIIKGRL